MHIHFATTFGFENIYPKLVTTVGTQLHGEIQYGEKGLLEFLELHLGQRHLDVTNALRVSAYRKTIKRLLTKYPDLYFSKSFQQDAWGTAQKLLVWRDELKWADWAFNCEDEKLPRLYVLTLIEKELEDLPNGVNDRWSNILNVLYGWDVELPLEKISVYEPQKLLNPFYFLLFSILKEKGVHINYVEVATNKSDKNDLSVFKSRLSSQSKVEKVACKNDGSLMIIKADNDKLIADALGEYLKEHDELKPLFVIPERGEILEEALVKRGLPAIGYTSKLADSAFDQLMSLTPLFLWKPIDMERLMQFLTLPNSPITKDLRKKLERFYTDQKIEKGVENTREIVEELFANEKINIWFSKSKNDINRGAPRNEVIAVYEDLKKWAMPWYAKIKKDDEEDKRLAPLLKLDNQCKDLIELIHSEKEEDELIHIIELQKWLNALESDRTIKQYETEKGGFEYTLDPANITENCDNIIYWNFLDSGNPVQGDANWSLEELEKINKPLHSVDNKIALWYSQLANAVNRAEKQLIVCIPNNQQGVEIDSNALYYDLVATFNSLHPITYTIDVNAKIEIGKTSVPTVSYPTKYLPKSKISWRIEDTEKFVERERDSFSSLSKLFFHPSAYVLNYMLGIRSVQIPEMEITNRIKGNIAHHTAEELWKIKDLFELADDQLDTTIQQQLRKQIEKEGTIFYAPKHKVAKIEYENIVLESLRHLIKSIRKNNWKFLEAEQKHELEGDIKLTGDIDLVLTRGDNEIAIVDLKWAGLSKKKEELLKKQELQLLIYERLLKKEDKTIYLQYYIINTQQFVSRTNEAFEDAIVISLDGMEENEHRDKLWDQMVKTYKERWRQIKSGKIEVGDEYFAKDIAKEFSMWNDIETFLAVPTKSKGRKESDPYSDYKNLIGRIQ